MTELLALAVWAAWYSTSTARIAFRAQTVKLRPAMKKLRNGLLPAVLVVAGFAPYTLAHGMPGPTLGGTNVSEPAEPAQILRDGISLDEAVSRAEQQYHARVVRTEVVDEDGRKVYVLKLLSENGRVFTVRIDANSGRGR
jgi:Peptidase propeptide and YPEB domain